MDAWAHSLIQGKNLLVNKLNTIWHQIYIQGNFLYRHINQTTAPIFFIPFFFFSFSSADTKSTCQWGNSPRDWETGCNRHSLASFLCTRAAVIIYIPKKIFSNLVTYYLSFPSLLDMNFVFFSLNFSSYSFQQRTESCAVLFLCF